MTSRFSLRLPSAAQVARYREQGLWIDSTLGAELEAGLRRNAAVDFRVWSDLRPHETTFGEIHQRALRIAAGFRAMGIGPGDVVSFQLPNWIEAVETFLATMFLGAISVPIVQIYGAKETRFVLRQTGARLHVTTNAFRNLHYRPVIEAMRGELPELRDVVYIDDQWGALLQHAPLERIHAGNPDDPAVIGFTSGTTADPKGAIHTHRSVLAEVRQRHVPEAGDSRMAPLNPPTGFDAWLTASPVAHVSGLQTAVLLPILLDRRAALIDRWDVEAVLEALTEGNLFLAAAATFFFNAMLAHPKFRPEHIHHMKYVVSGGAPVPRAFGEMCEEHGILLVRGYGSTEHPTVFGCSFDDPVEKRIGSDGRRIAGAEIELRDGDGNPVPPGVPGEIFTRGPDMFAGYTDPALNAGAFDADGWFCTGDVGVMDEDGYYTITDRTKDIIIRGGENISAAEVEEALAKMPGVLEVAAVAAPDPRYGERVCAFFRLREGHALPSMEAMRAHLANVGLAKQKWPEDIRMVADFSRTPSGKIRKVDLRAELRNAAA